MKSPSPLLLLGLAALGFAIVEVGAHTASVGGLTGWDVYNRFTEAQLRAILSGNAQAQIALTKNGTVVRAYLVAVDPAGNFTAKAETTGALLTFRAENVADGAGDAFAVPPG